MVANLEVNKVGDVPLTDDIILKNGLFVPNFHFNLISVSKLCIEKMLMFYLPRIIVFYRTRKQGYAYPLVNSFKGSIIQGIKQP